MKKRLLYGITVAAAILFILGIDFVAHTAWMFSALYVVMTVAGWFEFSAMTVPGNSFCRISGAAAVALLGTCSVFWGSRDPEAFSLLRQWAVPAALFFFLVQGALRWRKGSGCFEEGVLSLVGFLYLGVLPTYLLQLRYHAEGEMLVFLLILVVKLGDSGAYFTGKSIGRHKLCPVSPNKTVEGAAGGLAFSVAAALAGVFLLLPEGFAGIGEAAAAACVISLVAQGGDLVESLVKRSCNVKDSSVIIPELGGVLDIVDSLVFAAPALSFLLSLQQG